MRDVMPRMCGDDDEVRPFIDRRAADLRAGIGCLPHDEARVEGVDVEALAREPAR